MQNFSRQEFFICATLLLSYPYVRNYDGSWTEWGGLIGAPIEK